MRLWPLESESVIQRVSCQLLPWEGWSFLWADSSSSSFFFKEKPKSGFFLFS